MEETYNFNVKITLEVTLNGIRASKEDLEKKIKNAMNYNNYDSQEIVKYEIINQNLYCNHKETDIEGCTKSFDYLKGIVVRVINTWCKKCHKKLKSEEKIYKVVEEKEFV